MKKNSAATLPSNPRLFFLSYSKYLPKITVLKNSKTIAAKCSSTKKLTKNIYKKNFTIVISDGDEFKNLKIIKPLS